MTRRPDQSGGGLTGATGDLTPDDIQRDFEPGEWREASDAAHHADVTIRQASQSGHEHGAHGPEPEEPDEAASDEPRDSRIGGDERADHEEHF
jgi:hypothetical protein